MLSYYHSTFVMFNMNVHYWDRRYMTENTNSVKHFSMFMSKKHRPKPNSESGRVQSTPALSPAYNKQNHVFTFSVCVNF